MPGVVGDALGGIVVPVDVGIVPVVVVPVGSVVVGGTVFTVDSVDGPGVVTVQRKFNSQHEATGCYFYFIFYLLYMKPMHNELKTLTNVTK